MENDEKGKEPRKVLIRKKGDGGTPAENVEKRRETMEIRRRIKEKREERKTDNSGRRTDVALTALGIRHAIYKTVPKSRKS